MPIWIYQVSPVYAAIILVLLIDIISLVGLVLTRRFILPRLHYHDGINDAVSGTVQAIGVFYGITVGLIAVGVWNTNSNASDLVSKEAAAIAGIYRDIDGYPEPIRGQMRAKLREYTVFVIDQAFPAQKIGKLGNAGTRIMDEFQDMLLTFDPKTSGQSALHSETLGAYNRLIEYRRLRIDAVNGGLAPVMWAVIWVGAAISIGIAYFYQIQDFKFHSLLVGLMSSFLAMLLFMIVINDKPFYGAVSIPPDPYKLVLERVIDVSK
jgi:hypothetical protein